MINIIVNLRSFFSLFSFLNLRAELILIDLPSSEIHSSYCTGILVTIGISDYFGVEIEDPVWTEMYL